MDFNFNQALADKGRRADEELGLERRKTNDSRQIGMINALKQSGVGAAKLTATAAPAKTPIFSNLSASGAAQPVGISPASPASLPINEGRPGSGTMGRTLYSTDAAGQVTVPARSGYQTDGAGITPVQDDGRGTGGPGILSDDDAFNLRPADPASNPTPAQPKPAAQVFAARGVTKEDRSNYNLAEQGIGNIVRKAGNVYTDAGANPYLNQQFKEHDGMTGKQLMDQRIATDEARRVEAVAKEDKAQLDALEKADPRVRIARIEKEASTAQQKAAQDAAVNLAREQNPKLTKAQEMAIRYGVKDVFKNDGDGSDLTTPQQRTNASIDAARRQLTGLTHDDILKRTQSTTNTGRDNPEYDPNLAALVKLARSRKYGDDIAHDNFAKPANAATQQPAQPAKAATPQPVLPAQPSAQVAQPTVTRNEVAKKFRADHTMHAHKLGKETEHGVEVLDRSGKLIGYYR